MKEKLDSVKKKPLGEGAQARLLKEKLAELEKEIDTFRVENADLDRLRRERQLVSKLYRHFSIFDTTKFCKFCIFILYFEKKNQ